jgi:hypothetical protein
MAMIVAGHTGRLATGMHSRVMDTAGDLYLTIADDVMSARLGKCPTASNASNKD